MENENSPHRIPEKRQLHPHDEALIEWKGGLGDTAADTLQARRDKAHAAARLVQRKQQAHLLSLAPAVKREGPGPLASSLTSASAGIRLKKNKNNPHSRILDEAIPHFMKKTTYLSNETKSVHQFTSLAKTKAENAIKVDQQLAETRAGLAGRDGGNAIEFTFDAANATSRSNASKRKRLVHPTKKHLTTVYHWDGKRRRRRRE